MILVSCSGAPTIEPTAQCSPVFVYSPDGNISTQESYCICRKYIFSAEFVGPKGGSWQEPIKSCDRVVGWKPKEYGELSEYWQRLREFLEEIREEHGY